MRSANAGGLVYITQVLLVLLALITTLTNGAQELSYDDDGLDWGGTCVTSQRQSPINLVSNQFTSSQASSPSMFTLGTGSNVTVGASFHLALLNLVPRLLACKCSAIWHCQQRLCTLQVHNLGNQVRVLWTQAELSTATITLGSFYAQPNATGLINVTGTNMTAGLAETVLSITPTQFHFHTTSEHTMEGRFSPLELHLVANVTGANTSCSNSCTAVYSVLYDFSSDGLTGQEHRLSCILNHRYH